ncbi:histidine-type phosphatase [Klebsiella spallanzanii]|uniref:histidine-type phosphatase n=1 Tax=Klebsiella spallanzanii TaxID=2587528 RepID=UPI001159C2D3|nr:histidine-type phosphatase [Klebsiella spallanzanii]VUS42611.1 Periplasmic AppA protein [Klebsiella spallanzanii]
MKKLTLTLSGLCIACSMTLPEAMSANNNDLLLEKVVMMTRHGVRSQSNSSSVQENSPQPIPAFSVKDGELTMHGYAAVTLMGDYLNRYFTAKHFMPGGVCPDEQKVFIRSSAFQRTRMTARALADTLFPGCAVPVHSPEKKSEDTLFEPIVSGMAPLNIEKATQNVMASLGGEFDTARKNYAADILHMQKIVDPACQLTECVFINNKWEIKPDKQNINISLKGPIAKGSELGETFRLQYMEGMALKDVAFGHVSRAKDIASLMKLKEVKFDVIEHDPYIAARGGSQLMSQILYALEKGSGYQDTHVDKEISLSAPDADMVMYVAHDTNLGYLQSLLNVTWQLEGYPKDDTPPGSTLLFERYRDKKTQKSYVGITFMTQGLDQIRRLEPLTDKNPPIRRKINMNCKGSPDNWLCPIDEFAAKVNNRIDRTAIIAQSYAE